MTSRTFKQKLSVIRDFTAAALFAGGAIGYYHAATPPDTRPAEARHAFVDAQPIRLDWTQNFFATAQNKTSVEKPSQMSAKPPSGPR